MNSEADIIKKLIKKIGSGLLEIQVRSINSMHTKITLGVLDIQQLSSYP